MPKKTENYRKDIFATDDYLATLFKTMYGDKIIYVCEDKKEKDGYFYHHTKTFWKRDASTRRLSLLIAGEFFDNVQKIARAQMKKNDDDTQWKRTYGQINKLLSANGTESIIKKLKYHLYKDIEFDSNPYVIVFKNGVYDLKAFEFRTETKYDDYVSDAFSCGYNYKAVSKKDMSFIAKYFSQTLINTKEDVETFMTYLATSLLGKNVKNFCINNGCGDNNKSKLMEAVAHSLGDYAMRLDVVNLCGKKDRATLNGLNKKRFVYTEEPNKDIVLDGGFLKEITGCDKANWRKIYSADAEVKLHFSLFISCNDRPPISCVDEATRNRLIDFPFLSTFTDKDVDNKTRFKTDPYFETLEFRNKYRLAIFHYLLDYLKIFYKNNDKVRVSKDLRKRRDEYLLDSDDFYSWFVDTYEPVEDESKFIKISEIYKEFKEGTYYRNLKQVLRRKMNRKKLMQELLSRKSIKKCHREKYQPYINGKQKFFYNVFLGLQKRESEECEIDADSETDE